MRYRIASFLLLLVVVRGALILDCMAAERADPVPPIAGLTIHWKDRFLSVTGATIPGDSIEIHYLEAYCRAGSSNREWGQTIIRHKSRWISASNDNTRLQIEDLLEDGVTVKHLIQAGDDDVTFTVTVANPTDQRSQAHWA